MTPRQREAHVARWFAARRTELLLDLANLRDESAPRFRQRWGVLALPESDARLLAYRDELRLLWRNPRDPALARWLDEVAGERGWVLAYWGSAPRVLPNYFLLPLALALGVVEVSARTAICANPACPAPFFLRGRKTQRYCDRPACLAHGQRQHKLRWWRKQKARQLKKKPTRREQHAAEET
jgi:hypothetical protein